jgi:hypothetical protein
MRFARLPITSFNLLGFLLIVISLTVFLVQKPQEVGRRPAELAQRSLYHFTGGFSIKSDAEIANAIADGIHTTLIYGYAPLPKDPVAKALTAHKMKLIDAMPEKYLYYYECHIHNTCSASTYPELTSVQALLTDITNHLQQEKNNPLIVGYWVLDDWNFGDGTGKDLLVQINNLIHRYTPGKPSICGFGGELPPLPGKGGWNNQVTDNFSPQGCDMIGLYIYAESGSTGTYDWSMSNILPAAVASFKKRGWDSTKEPLVGIPQAFGGVVDGESWPVPDAKAVETQTKTYCQHGAIGIIFYDWDPSAQSPMTNSQITQGIKNGIADCKKIWQ